MFNRVAIKEGVIAIACYVIFFLLFVACAQRSEYSNWHEFFLYCTLAITLPIDLPIIILMHIPRLSNFFFREFFILPLLIVVLGCLQWFLIGFLLTLDRFKNRLKSNLNSLGVKLVLIHSIIAFCSFLIYTINGNSAHFLFYLFLFLDLPFFLLTGPLIKFFPQDASFLFSLDILAYGALQWYLIGNLVSRKVFRLRQPEVSKKTPLMSGKTKLFGRRLKLGQLFLVALLLVLSGTLYVLEFGFRERRVYAALNTGDYRAGERISRGGLAWYPFSLEFKELLGRSLSRQKRFSEAEAILLEVVRDRPANTFVLDELATLYLEQSKLDQAEEYAWKLEKFDKRLAELGGPLTDAYSHLTEIYRRRGDYKKAEEYGIKAIENAKYLPTVPRNLRTAPVKKLVEIYNEIGRYGEALTMIGEILKYEDDVSCLFEGAKTNEYLKAKESATDGWKLFLKHADKKFVKERAFAEQRLIEIEKGNFLTPPSPKNRLNWGEIPKTE